MVNSDAVKPGAPLNLSLELVANGIKAEWDPPAYTEDITYSFYRDTKEITTTDGMAPLAAGIAQTLVVDPTPSLTAHWYAITAVDAVGNESPPSNADYLNVQLLPVSGIQVVQADNQPPEVTWTHPGGDITGYDIYLGPEDALFKLNPTLLTVKGYMDTGYSGDKRRHTIVTVDNNDVESLGRSLTLPVVRAAFRDGSRIKRGIMNRLDYVVLNEGVGRVENIRLKVKVGSHDHTSEPFSLDPDTSRTIPVVVGGYDDLTEGLAARTTTIEVTPRTNETLQIIRSSQVQVTDGMLRLQILNEEFTRAASGKVQFTIENTGEAEIEIVTAKNSGKSASDQITFYLLDEDGNVLTNKAFKQVTGEKLVTLSNKNTVARIAAGETFTSDLMSMPVPANAPDNIILRQDIDHVFYHQGQATQVKMDGLSTTHAVTLVDTAYYGELLDTTPQSSTGDRDIVITGQAMERSGGESMANVPLTLVITLDGFERSYDVFTGDNGVFTHRFKPLAGESGIYRVRAVHPDLTDKPMHGQFVINKASPTPAILNLNAPKNYTNTIQIRVQTGDGTTVNNLHLEYAAEDQPFGEKPAGIHLTPGQPIAQLGGNKTAYLPFTIWADNTTDQIDKVVLKVKSAEPAPDAWGSVTINTYFSQAIPVLWFTPNHVETGVAHEHTVTETVTLKNNGLADMHDVQLSLLNSNGPVAPNWVYLNTTTAIKNLAIGSTQRVGVTFAPTNVVAEGDYAFKLRVKASNHATADINLYAAVTQSGAGNILFKLSDIYTGTIDKNGNVVQGLDRARVKLKNEEAVSIEYNQNSDSFGEVYFENLPAGPYKCRITANNHQEYIGRIWIKPGVTVNEDVFLDYNLVTVEWQVNEITIEDKYEIVLSATYETNVPAAVVVVEPSSVTLPKMKAGDVFNGEFTLTNHGLIRADNLDLTIPTDDLYFKYEFLAGLPSSLGAKERITVPYRVTSIKSLEPDEDGQATGGGCSTYRTCVVVGYRYECANGQWTKGAVNYCYTRIYGSCGGGGGGVISTGGGGGTWSVGGSSGSGTVSKPAPKPKTIDGVELKMFWVMRQSLNLTLRAGWKKFSNQPDASSRFLMTSTNGVASVLDSQGKGFFFEYEFDEATQEQYARIETSAGKVKEVWYDRDFETRRVAINGRTVEKIAKDGRNLLVTDEQGNISRKNYDEWDNLTKVIYPDGSSISYKYEHKYNKWVEEIDENDVVTRYAYDDGGNLIKKTEAAGSDYERITEYTYDDDGNLLTTLRLADANTVEALTRLRYDLQSNLTSIIDPEGGITSFASHDAMGNVLTKIDARGKQWNYEYDAAGQLKKVIDPLGNATEFFYDQMGKKIKEVDANNMAKIYEYDKRNHLIKITDALGNITRFEYNLDGKLVKQIDPEGKAIQYEYDPDGRLLKTTDGNGNQIEMEYGGASGPGCSSCSGAGGASNQPARITYPTFAKEFIYDKRGRQTIEKNVLSLSETYHTNFGYDRAGNLIARTDKEDNITGYTYDALNRLKTVTDALDQETEYFYDNRDNLTALTDANGNTTWFEYDKKNRLTKEIRPEGQSTAYQYDPAGNLIGKTDAKNQKVAYYYDDAGRLVQIRYFIAEDHVNPVKTVTFSFDQVGNLTGYNDDITSATYTYDELNRK